MLVIAILNISVNPCVNNNQFFQQIFKQKKNYFGDHKLKITSLHLISRPCDYAETRGNLVRILTPLIALHCKGLLKGVFMPMTHYTSQPQSREVCNMNHICPSFFLTLFHFPKQYSFLQQSKEDECTLTRFKFNSSLSMQFMHRDF